MEITYQITQILNRIINKVSKPLTDKGTNTEHFKSYQRIFNSLSDANKKFILKKLLYSRARLIKHGFETKQSVHLEGLGTFKYRKDREIFYDKVHKKIAEQGYNKLSEVPKDLKHEITNEANKELDQYRLDNYFERIKVNKDKRNKPTPISIKLNNGGKW